MKKKNSREIPIDEPKVAGKIDEEKEINEEATATNEAAKHEDIDPIDALIKENEELKEKIIRKTAELDNALKRGSKEKMEMIDYANEKLLSRLLEIYDDFSNAVDAGRKLKDAESIQSGVEMIYKKMSKFLEEEGVKVLESPEGKPFDVEVHDALLSMPSELPEGTVVQVVQNGYTLRDKVIRHARVITSTGEPAEANDEMKEENNE